MTLLLSSSIFLAVRAEDLVILDAARGEYLLLPGGGAALAVSHDSNEVWGACAELAEALRDLGALYDGETPVSRPTLPASPVHHLGDDLRAAMGPRELLRWGLASLDMVSGYWRKPFPILIAAEAQAPVHLSDQERLIGATATFRRLLPWVPFQGVCLFRSLMLRAYLRRAKLSASLVIGCRTWPFEAHCWLQAGDLVLDDTADHVASFTPLMVVPG